MTASLNPELVTKLPKELQEQLRLGRTGNAGPTAADHIRTALEKSKRPLDVNEILVAVWKGEKIVLKRTTAMTALATLRKRGEVRQPDRGTFELGAEEAETGTDAKAA